MVINRKKRGISMADHAWALLGAAGNRSRYLDRTTEERSRTAADALHTLRANGWTGSLILEAHEALTAYHHRMADPLSKELRAHLKGARTGKAWEKLVAKLDEPLAACLWVVVLELRADHVGIRAELEG